MQWKLANYSSSINRSLILTPRHSGRGGVVPLGVCGAGDHSPLKFITIAEDIGFINELGFRLLKRQWVNSDILVSVRR